MPDVSATLMNLTAVLVAVAVTVLVAGGVLWLTVRLVNAVSRQPTAVGYPKALLVAALALLAQAAAGGAVVAPATAFARVSWTTVGPGLVAAAAVAGVAAVLATVAVCGLALPARAGRATAVGLVFTGLVWAAAGGLVAARSVGS